MPSIPSDSLRQTEIMAPARRTTRAKPPKKYNVDPFEGIQELLVVSSDSGSDTSEPDASETEDEFDLHHAAAAEEEEVVAEEDEVMSAEGLLPSLEDEELAAGNDSDRDIDIANVHSVVNLAVPAKRKQATVKRVPIGVNISEVHKLPAFDDRGVKAMHHNVPRVPRRGLPDVPHVLAKESRVIYSVGPAVEDIVAHTRCRDKWIDQPTLPTRKAKKGDVGGLGYSYFHSKERRQREAAEGWDWYYGQGCREIFSIEQKYNFLDLKETKQLIQRNLNTSDPFLVGPTSAPKLVEGLEPLASFNTSPAWSKNGHLSTKSACILNAGARVQCLEWAPNHNGCSQYLAVVTMHEPEHNGYPNAYTASASYQTCLQIWEFTSLHSEAQGGSKIDYSKTPILRFIISFAWGRLKKLKWCPVLDREMENVSDEQTLRLGLLAGVWEDGKVRVLDLEFVCPVDTTPRYLNISKAAFESTPPSTICTGVIWLSSTSIAASCANGYVAIWNLADSLRSLSKFDQNSSSDQELFPVAKPWFYQQIHQGYIIGMTSAYPSRPHLLITKGIDGFTRLSDLRAPHQDTVVTPRDRVAQPHLLWHDVSQIALSPDENYDLKSYGLRLFYKSQAVGRMDALVTDLAGSPVHPFVLLGCANGSVWSMSPMKRLRAHKRDTFQQIWFKHEWRRGTPGPPQQQTQPQEDIVMQDADTQNDTAEPQLTHQDTRPQLTNTSNILTSPLIRFTEGYKLHIPDFSQQSRTNNTESAVAFVTIYEEKTAVTKVCWNPNLSCGTWAAAGMASGLVRVEDLAVD
jgi:transcription factor C subunit 6